MPVTYATVEPQLREHYHNNSTQIFIEGSNPKLSPFIAGLQTRNDIDDDQGRGYVIPISTARGSAVSNSFAKARAKSKGTTVGSAAKHDDWVVTAVTKNATAHWDREAILSCQTSEKLFDTMTTEIDARISKMKFRMAIDAFEGGYGRAATITAAPTATPDTVTVSLSCVNRFEEGDELVAAATLAGALRSATALRVTQIDEETGVLTLSGSPVALSWANGDILFFDGDHTDSVVTSVAGMQMYLPDAAPMTALFGVTRTGIPAVAGRRMNCSSYDLLTALMKAAERSSKVGNVVTQVFVSTEDFGNMSLDKDRVKIIEMNVGEFSIGFGAAELATPQGPVKILTEMMLEQGRFYMGDPTDKEYAPFLVHTGDLVQCDDFTGSSLKDVDGETMYEQRWFFRGNIAFPAPGKWIVGHSVPA